CPLCKQRLTKQHLATLSGDYQSSFDKIKEKIAKLEEEKKSFENELRLARKDEHELEVHQKELNRLSPKLAEMEEKQRSMASDSKKIDGKKQKLHELKEALKDEQYALEERKQLKQ